MLIHQLLDEVSSLNSNDIQITLLPYSKSKYIEIYGQREDSESFDSSKNYIVVNNEIIIFKDIYFSIFLECHKALKIRNVDLSDDEKLKYQYGLLLTSPGNHTLLNDHEKLVYQLISKQQQQDVNSDLLDFEFKYVSMLLRSSISRINKSSCLWTFYEKLIVLLHHHFKYHHTDFVLRTILQSAKMHHNNYYCWSFARFFKWFIEEIIQGVTLDEDKYFQSFYNFCTGNVFDNSSWVFLIQLFIPSCDTEVASFYENRYKYMVSNLREWFRMDEFKPVKTDREVDLNKAKKRFSDLIKFIENSYCKSYIPYRCLLLLTQEPKLKNEFVKQLFDLHGGFFQSVIDFERKFKVKIVLCNGYTDFEIANENDNQIKEELKRDVLFIEGLKINGNKKRMLMWYDNFYINSQV
ncbi:hypothetical protein PACTADRAFT_33966 [Pachysolen tannophilus NRRL Y-2460]|uniref:Uncharacterized protein n=1 Tax=Pachysolen tannophilus NRRL Y-2460 TaxID=669874 RepID=A0A1E4TUR6_PACTA|nr:hypothetical protein PACTADRAFT_33966 [Pachysolen tannophilus NRRL Y-2460]